MTEKKTNKSVNIHNRQFFGEGDMIIRQGESGDTAYLIQSGKVRVYVENNGKSKDVAVLAMGEIFGEMALVVDGPRAASVIAVENTTLIPITRPMMIEKMAVSDPTIKALMKMMIKRLKEANETALNKKGNFEDMAAVAENMYKNVADGLEGAQKSTLERSVKPHMDAFLRAIGDFQKLYKG